MKIVILLPSLVPVALSVYSKHKVKVLWMELCTTPNPSAYIEALTHTVTNANNTICGERACRQ